jgi:glycosyltransferase involved in cell wall biosynthesis
VHVAYFSGGLNYDRMVASGVTLHPVRARGSYDPLLAIHLARLVRALRPDLLQTWLTMCDVLGGTIALATGTRWILSDRCLATAWHDSLKARLLRALAPRAHAIVANSEAAAGYWGARLPAAPPRFVVRNALPLEEIDAAPPADPRQFNLSSASVILSIGRLDPQKNVMTLLAALKQVVRATPSTALICGVGSLEADVRRCSRDADIQDRILVPGFVENPWSWMKRAAVFVSLSHFEGMPNAVMEAMAARCPVVVSDIPEHREILDAASAYLVPRTDPEAAAEAILKTLSRPPIVEKRIETARARAECWSIDRVAREYAAIYDAVCAGSVPPVSS